MTTSVSGPAGPGAGGRAPPARAGAALPDTRPGPRRPPPAALTRDGAGRGHRSGGRSRDRAPIRRHRGHPARVLGRAGREGGTQRAAREAAGRALPAEDPGGAQPAPGASVPPAEAGVPLDGPEGPLVPSTHAERKLLSAEGASLVRSQF